MIKTYLIFMLLLPVSIGLFAQGSLAQGKSQFNLGLGLSNWGVPVYLGLDHAIHPEFTLGGELSFRNYDDRFNNNNYNHSILGISGNVNYHFNQLLDIPARWDFYAGLNIGFYRWNSSNDYPGANRSGVGLGGQVGGRYFLTNKLGLNLEFGGGNAFSSGKFGITIKL